MSALWPEPARARPSRLKVETGCIDGPRPTFQSRLEPNTAVAPLKANSERGPSLAVLFEDAPEAEARR